MSIELESLSDFFVALFALGGGASFAAYGLFKFLGAKWIESKFAEQLEQVRHEHAKELHELKGKLDSELSRVIKLQDREFQVLSEAWVHLREALDHVLSLTSVGHAYADLSQMGDARLAEFLKGDGLSDVHQAEIIAIDRKERNTHYQSLRFWYDLHEAKRAASKYRRYVVNNDIFLRAELSTDLDAISGILWKALIAREIGEEAKDIAMWIEAAREMREQVTPLVEHLRTTVRALLRAGF